MQIEWAAAGILWVEIYFPCLAQAVGLHKVPLIMDMESMIGGMILQVGDKAGDVDDGHVVKAPEKSNT